MSFYSGILYAKFFECGVGHNRKFDDATDLETGWSECIGHNIATACAYYNMYSLKLTGHSCALPSLLQCILSKAESNVYTFI
jgi:hypothetical protein